ncbi:outer membrane beta-barrel family protein [Flavitalea sp.]|nr:TonB-dependent receptor [Flavitalea sp.]
MIKTTLISGCLLLALAGNTQVTGKVITQDSATKDLSPLAAANVSLLKSQDSSMMISMFTDTAGNYRITPLMAGDYLLKISNIGFSSWTSQKFYWNGKQTVNFGSQLLQPAAEQLEAVQIRATKPITRQNPYGTIVNIAGSVFAKGNNLLSILERSPGVLIDPRTNTISLNGKGGVLVMINNRPLRMPANQLITLLTSMSANDVEQVELLTSPGAGFDAEGSGGIINIISKKSIKKGTNGSMYVTAGQGWGPKGMASVNLSHIGSKVDLSGAYSYSVDRTRTDLFIISEQVMPTFGGSMKVVVWDTSKATQQNHNANYSVIIHPDTLTNIGIILSGNLSKRMLTVTDQSNYLLMPDSLLYFKGLIKSPNDWKDYSVSTFFDRFFPKQQKLSFGADFLHFKNENPSTIQTSLKDKNEKPVGNNDTMFSPFQYGFAQTKISVAVLKSDYQKELTTTIKMEAGLKGNLTQSSSLSGLESLVDGSLVSRAETINQIMMNEHIAAAYTSFNFRPGKAANFIVGGRYEYASTEMKEPVTGKQLLSRNMSKFFPAIFVVLRPGSKSEWQISYTERITRPTYNDLASFVRYSDATAVYTGNPGLRATISRNLKLGYIYRNHSFTMMLSRDDHPIANYQLTESKGSRLLYVSPQNLRYKNYLNLQINSPWRLTEWWNSNINLVAGWRQFALNYSLLPVRKTYFAWSLNFNQTFQLTKNYSAEISGWYNSQTFNGTVKVSAMGSINAGIKKELNKNYGRLQLSVSDIFRTMRIHSWYGTITKEAFGIKNHVAFDTETRIFPVFRLTYSKSFGNGSKNYTSKPGPDEINRVRKE